MSLNDIEKKSNEFSNMVLLDGNQNAKQQPYYSSGARSLIRIGGKEIAIAKSIRWSISYNATPITTIDSQFPWDIDVGTGIIRASLSQFIDPIRGPETDHLFNIMRASAHQPMVEMQVIDTKTGSAIFFSKGMFVEVSGDMNLGQLSTMTSNFIGIQYQHFVSQNFKPYKSITSMISNFTKGLQNLVSDATGGTL